MAACIAEGLNWPAGVNEFRSRPDFLGHAGEWCEVKTRTQMHYDLAIPKDGRPSAWYYLVLQESPIKFWVFPPIQGHRAMRPGFLRVQVAGRPAAYFIPQQEVLILAGCHDLVRFPVHPPADQWEEISGQENW